MFVLSYPNLSGLSSSSAESALGHSVSLVSPPGGETFIKPVASAKGDRPVSDPLARYVRGNLDPRGTPHGVRVISFFLLFNVLFVW